MEVLVGFIVLAVCFVLYFLPACVAGFRKHPQIVPITLLNVFVGWTFIGWVVALVWSSTNFSAKNPG